MSLLQLDHYENNLLDQVKALQRRVEDLERTGIGESYTIYDADTATPTGDTTIPYSSGSAATVLSQSVDVPGGTVLAHVWADVQLSTSAYTSICAIYVDLYVNGSSVHQVFAFVTANYVGMPVRLDWIGELAAGARTLAVKVYKGSDVNTHAVQAAKTRLGWQIMTR